MLLLQTSQSSHCTVPGETTASQHRAECRNAPSEFILQPVPLCSPDMIVEYADVYSVFPALIDSGSMGDFLNLQMAKDLRLPLIELKSPIRLNTAAMDWSCIVHHPSSSRPYVSTRSASHCTSPTLQNTQLFSDNRGSDSTIPSSHGTIERSPNGQTGATLIV